MGVGVSVGRGPSLGHHHIEAAVDWGVQHPGRVSLATGPPLFQASAGLNFPGQPPTVHTLRSSLSGSPTTSPLPRSEYKRGTTFHGGG